MGPLGELLRTHDSLGSMTTPLERRPNNALMARPPYCHGIRVARRPENASPAHINKHVRATNRGMQARQHSRQYLTVCSMCDRWQIPIRRKVRSSKPSRATTAFLISRSRRQRAQGVEIKFQHCFSNQRAYAPAASLAYDGDTRPNCEMLWSTRNVSIGKTAPGYADAPYSTKLSMRYPGKADHDPRGGPSFSPAL